MPKLVPLDELRVGMYVHDLNCGWLDHPFTRNRFLINDAETLARIRRMPLSAVWIDADKSSVQPAAATEETTPEDEPVCATPVSYVTEREYARRIRDQASRAVEEAMNRCSLGHNLDLTTIAHIVDDMLDLLERHQQALLGMCRLRSKDRYTFDHSVNVAILAATIGKDMGLARGDLHELALGGLLHDVGKSCTPLRILNKPSKLSEREFAIMKRHVEHGEHIASRIPQLSAAARAIIVEHHERLDGSGYPLGLKDNEIGLFGRIVAVCDVYDAMTADRCYRSGMEPTEVLRLLLQWSKGAFDTRAVHHLVRSVGVYPVGTLVRMASDRLAMVIQPGTKGLLHPVVRVFYDIERQLHLMHHDIDLSHEECDSIVAPETKEQWGFAPELLPQPE